MCNTRVMTSFRLLFATLWLIAIALAGAQRLEPGTLSYTDSGTFAHNDWSVSLTMSGSFFPRIDTADPEDAYLSGTGVQVNATAGVALNANAPENTPGYTVKKIEIKVGGNPFEKTPRVQGPSLGHWVRFTSTHFPSGQPVAIEVKATFVSGTTEVVKTLSRSFVVVNRVTLWRLHQSEVLEDAAELGLSPSDTLYYESVIEAVQQSLVAFYLGGNYSVIQGQFTNAQIETWLTGSTAWGAVTHGNPSQLQTGHTVGNPEQVINASGQSPSIQNGLTQTVFGPDMPRTHIMLAVACTTVSNGLANFAAGSEMDLTQQPRAAYIGWTFNINPTLVLANGPLNTVEPQPNEARVTSLYEVIDYLRNLLNLGFSIEAAVKKANAFFDFFDVSTQDFYEGEDAMVVIGGPATLQHVFLMPAERGTPNTQHTSWFLSNN